MEESDIDLYENADWKSDEETAFILKELSSSWDALRQRANDLHTDIRSLMMDVVSAAQMAQTDPEDTKRWALLIRSTMIETQSSLECVFHDMNEVGKQIEKQAHLYGTRSRQNATVAEKYWRDLQQSAAIADWNAE